MKNKRLVQGSRRSCKFDYIESSLFFSLVDYRNTYFTSEDPKKIIEFYNSIKNTDELIRWMKERPKGFCKIHEIDGGKDIIVVIPTADFNGKYAKNCRENVFKGLHIVFVESAEIPDQYFNGAHNVNIGIKKALEYNPKWIVFCSEDVLKIDSIDILNHQLSDLDNKEYDVVFTKPSNYHSSYEKISYGNLLFYAYYRLTTNPYRRTSMKLFKKFEIKYLLSPISGKFSKLFKKGYQFVEIQDFGIYSSKWISKVDGEVYDETFINSGEDTDLSLRFSFNKDRMAIIDYRIGDAPPGIFLGNGPQRGLREIAGIAYLNYKWRSILDREKRDRK